AYNVFLLLGGIGLFLFGISYMGKGLEQAAGDNLRVWLEKLTTSPLKAVLVGALATAAIQSSGATMVMAVGFVNAQMMTLSQALYIMLGASIGTTITAQIIALDIDPWAPLILFIGILLTQFIKNRTAKKAGAIILGFGILFVGINLMGDAVKAMELGGLVASFLHNVHNPVLSLLFGAAFTLVIQSSSASVGILQVIVASSLGASMGLEEVVYMIMGMNVGAVAPLVLSALSGNRLSKRAAASQTAIKLLSAISFSILMLIFPAIIAFVKNLSPNDVSRQVANFHTIYNSVSAVLMFPLIKPVAKLAEKLMPDSAEDEFYSRKLLYCSNDVSKSPAIMITQAHKEIMRFADICRANLHTALESFFDRDEDKAEAVIEREKTINFLNHEINSYLVSLYGKGLHESDVSRVSTMLSVASDLERIGDLAENIAEYTQIAASNKAKFSPAALDDLGEMAEKVEYMVDLSMKCYDKEDRELLAEARAVEEQVDAMQEEKTENHIERLKAEICDPRGGVVYTDMVSDLERISDHATNIAEGILGINASIEELAVEV
ncbi:MAG: Na/Pi cotransporter family protein, partial [Firmicutes bacterium]|nr:Na/Pi cotransporter family protein [Bacillota bacterium]